MVRKFLNLNREMSKWISRFFPQSKCNLYTQYDETVAKYMNIIPDQVVVDVGGGRKCSYKKFKNSNLNTKIVGIDISMEELNHNKDIDAKIVCDVTKNIPLPENSVNIVSSRTVIEHLNNTEDFIINSKRILKNDGYFIAFFPCKFALFSIVNQLLPEKLSKKILLFFHPYSKFTAYYDRCYYSSFVSMLKGHDFEIEEIKLSYWSSTYVNFFIPFFIVYALYEFLLKCLNIKNLCAYILVVAKARKKIEALPL